MRKKNISLSNIDAPTIPVQQPLTPQQRREFVRIIAERLFKILAIALTLQLGWIVLVMFSGHFSGQSGLPVVMFVGVLGGVIGLQNRLKTLYDDDLVLLTTSIRYLLLAPLVGGFLAMLLYIIFISGLISGDLFPEFKSDYNAEEIADKTKANGIKSLFHIHATGYESYAKLIVWCFIAGFSERFVTNIIGRLENAADSDSSIDGKSGANTSVTSTASERPGADAANTLGSNTSGSNDSGSNTSGSNDSGSNQTT